MASDMYQTGIDKNKWLYHIPDELLRASLKFTFDFKTENVMSSLRHWPDNFISWSPCIKLSGNKFKGKNMQITDKWICWYILDLFKF